MFSIGHIEYCFLFSLLAHSRDNDAPICITQRLCGLVLLDLDQTETMAAR